MKILILHPKWKHGPVQDQDRGRPHSIIFGNPELTLPAVAACIPKKHNVRLIHETYEDIDYSKDYDLVGISCFTLFAPQAYEIADKFRKIGVSVVLGGYHPTALPEEAKQHADSVVIGEAENNFPQLLKDFEEGKMKSFYYSKKVVKPEDIPPLRRELINFKLLTEGLRVTRGCPSKCEFCSITYFYNHTFRRRPIKNVIKELKSIANRIILIHDANLAADLDYSKAFFKAMIKEKINKKWLGNGNIYTLGKDEEFLRLARKSGCICWTTGFESISQKSLNGVKKSANKVNKYGEWVKNIHKYNMAVNGLFIFGFDHDTPEIFDKTLKALYDWEIDAGEFNILTPLPGTPLFNKLDKEGRILTRDWSKYSQTQVVFQPKNMTPEELMEGTKKVTEKFYSHISMTKRIVGLMKLSLSPCNMFLMPFMNSSRRIWYKREFNIK